MVARAKKPETRQAGQIIAKGPGKWLLRVYKGTNDAGKRQYTSKMFAGTDTQARKELVQMQAKVDNKTHVDPCKVTLRAYLTGLQTMEAPRYGEGWSGWVDTREWSQRTRQDNCERIRLDILPYLGGLRLDAITREGVQQWVKTLATARELSRRTIQISLVLLKSALADAVEDGKLAKNPCRKIALPAAPVKDTDEEEGPSVLTAAQMQTFLEKTSGTPDHALWTLLLSTGVRFQEAQALRWTDIVPAADETAVIRISRAMKTDKLHKRTSIGETKTGVGRTIPIPAETWGILKAHRKTQMKAGTASILVFPGQRGVNATMDISAARRRWKAALTVAGLPAVRLYDGRHSHQTALLMAGENPKVVAERGGHSVEVLMKTYAHALQHMQQAAAGTVGDLLFRRAAQ
jgi:integrase